jgi:hypothetical protein
MILREVSEGRFGGKVRREGSEETILREKPEKIPQH